MLDENKINELVEKEVIRIVEKRVNAFGKQRIEDAYRRAIWDAVYSYLDNQASEIQRTLESTISIHKDDWKKRISDDIAERLVCRIESALSDY
jgi:hypothetical protein